MAPSTEANNAIGAIGGAVLAACLAPQLLKLHQTRSARDLSYIFLALYNIGLTLTFVYLFYENAIAGYVCILIELAFGLLMVAAKAYLDTFGPYGSRAVASAAQQDGKLTSSESLAKEIRIEVRDFAAGHAAPFPLLRTAPSPSHAAQHVLLDASLAHPPGTSSSSAASDRATPAASDCCSQDDGGASQAPCSPDAVLRAVRGMLEAALAGAGLPVLRMQAHSMPSFRTSMSSAPGRGSEDEETGQAEEAAADMLFLSCRDSYATALFYPATATLSVDLLGASDSTAAQLGRAAEALCGSLLAAWPGTRVAGTTVKRLPRE